MFQASQIFENCGLTFRFLYSDSIVFFLMSLSRYETPKHPLDIILNCIIISRTSGCLLLFPVMLRNNNVML